MAPRDEAIEEQGFSSPVALRIEAPQRRSIRTIYEAKWSVFVRWCEASQVDFQSPSIKQIADFLLHLFQEKNLQPSTIDGYRSAIADKLGNASLNVGKDENLTRLLDSFHRDRPKRRRGFPSWNLSVVLHQLTKPPFEPLRKASLKHLTLDTKLIGQKFLFTLLQVFWLKITWQRRVQIMWLQWSFQPWPPLWINPWRKIGLFVQSERYAIIWTRHKTSDRAKNWSLSPSKRASLRISRLLQSRLGLSKQLSFVMNYQIWSLSLCTKLRLMMLEPLRLPKLSRVAFL